MKINFRNKIQVILYKFALKGQISDGLWENSNPLGHWVSMLRAELFVAKDASELGPDFRPMRKYNFDDEVVLEHVGDRMKFLVSAFIAFSDYPISNFGDLGTLIHEDSITNVLRKAIPPHNSIVDHCKAIRKRISKHLDVRCTKPEFNMLRKKIKEFEISDKDIKRELRDMSTIVNTMGDNNFKRIKG